jgi:hypothetical protein
VGHDHKGIFKLKIDTEVREVKSKENYNVSYQGGMGLKIFSSMILYIILLKMKFLNMILPKINSFRRTI